MNRWAKIVSDLVEKGIGASPSEQNLSVSVAFLPFDRSLEAEFRKSQLELEQRRRQITVMIGLSLLAGLSFLLVYLIILQIRRVKARRAIEARKVKMEEELKRMLEEEKVREVPVSPEEKAMQELRENLEKVFKQDPEEVANVIKLWLVERGT
jgi:flagellar M-ring protein FliF